MDWRGSKGRALLWKAYPAGHLPTRGVFTLGGWLCEAGPATHDGTMRGACRWRGPADELRAWPSPLTVKWDAHAAGDLLPLPDENDPPTVTAMLADLARAADYPYHPCATTWVRVEWAADPPQPDGRILYRCGPGLVGWSLRTYGYLAALFSGIDCRDPLEALVRARAALAGGLLPEPRNDE